MNDGSLGSLLLLVLLIAMFWFVAVRPARKRQMRQQQLVDSLTVGQKVVTTSGLHATIVALDESTMDLEIAPGVVVTWARAAVLGVL